MIKMQSKKKKNKRDKTNKKAQSNHIDLIQA